MIKEQFITTRVRQTSLKKARLLSLFYILLSCPLSLTAQVSTVNYAVPTADAMVANGGVENTNFGSQTTIDVFHRNNQQIPMVFRSFIQFDLSNIPANAIIVSADLKLTAQAVDNGQNHPLYIERVNGTNWSESTITWNAQPGVATADQISIPHSATSAVGLQTFDVKNHVQQMVANPGLNKGWRIRLQQEQAAVDFGVQYHSKEAAQAANRPQLTVEYILPIEINTTVDHCTAGQTDGTLSAFLSGGSTYGLSNIFFYKTVRNASYDGTATITNVKTTHNVQYNTSTKEITAENLEPGVYILGVFDAEYYSGSDQRFVFYRHVLVGRNGEVTTGILYPDYRYQENVTISKDKPTATNPLDRANTNYHTHTSLIPLRVADAPNVYEYASLIQYEMDFDNQLAFTQADLRMKAWAQFFRFRNSSNALTYSRITSAWEEETVTWNTRPSIDASTGVTLAATPTMGYETTHLFDTLDLLTFIPHWQSHPEDNHGIELALETYGATDYAQRSFKSASNENNYLELQWEVKDPVSASFDDNTNRGSITVHASGGTAPYTYLISHQPISDLVTIWNGIKDSTQIDSLYFMRGKEQNRTKVFDHLEGGRYYVAVFDNSGTEILQEDIMLSTTPVLFESENLTYQNQEVFLENTGSSVAGTGTVYGNMAIDTEGGVEIKVEVLDDLIAGFNYEAEQKTRTVSDLEFGVELLSDGTLKVVHEGNFTDTYSVAVDDHLTLLKGNDAFMLLKNGTLMNRTPIYGGITNTMKFDFAIPAGKTTKFKIIGYSGGFIKPSIKYSLVQPDCPNGNAELTFMAPSPYFIHASPSINIVNQQTSTTVYSGTSFDATVSLPVGVYKIQTSYTLPPSVLHPLGISLFKEEELIIGFPVEWLYDGGDNIAEFSGTNTLYPLYDHTLGQASSDNLTPNLGDWWYNFETDQPYKTWFDPLVYKYADITMVGNTGDAIKVHIEPYLLPGMISKFVMLNGSDFVWVHNKKTFTIQEIGDQLSLLNSGEIILPSSGTPYLNPESGILRIETGLYNEVYLATNKVSYCKQGVEKVSDDGYIKETRYLDGGYYDATHGKLQFQVDRNYELASGTHLEYSIFNANQVLVAGVSNNGASVVGGAPLLINEMGLNAYVIDLDALGLSDGFYTLEITNSKGEKKQLKFQK